MQGGFVPQFEQIRTSSEEKAVQFYYDVRLSLTITVGGFCSLCMLLFFGGAIFFDSDLLLMTALMMPGILFLILYALNSSVLQCQRRYFLPAFAPALFNLVWIITAFCLRSWDLRSAMLGLSISMVFAFAAQWYVTAHPLRIWGIKSLRAEPFSEGVRSLIKPFSLGVVGVGAAQINSALDALFASWADPSGPAYLWYAIRLQQLPLSLLGIALTNALLPPLSRSIEQGAFSRFNELLQGAVKKTLILMIPCTVGIFLFSEWGIGLIYGHGSFLASDVTKTAVCLQYYGLGLVPTALTLLYANAFYAQREYTHPMRCSLASVGCNIVLNGLFVFGFSFGAASIALATALSSALNCALLAFKLYARGIRRQEEY